MDTPDGLPVEPVDAPDGLAPDGREGATTGDEAITRTYAWNERKRGFDPHQISVARDVLVNQRWL